MKPSTIFHKLLFGSIVLPIFAFILIQGCKPGEKAEEGEKKINTITPVKIVNPENGSLTDYVELNATSNFLKKEFVKSSANGYISDIKVSIGDIVQKGQVLFTIQTKEARALSNSKANLDTSIRFKGLINIISNRDGVVSGLSHQKGDYVQDAEQLAMLSDLKSLVFLIDAPFEYNKYLTKNKECNILLPDGISIKGRIESDLPSMDIGSQTQNYVLRPINTLRIPEGLIARVQILRSKKTNALSLPKEAVLSDEKEENFWIMKLINDSTAVKVPVQIGMQNPKQEEILTPILKTSDRILISGNYGLEDTAKVKITK